MPSGGQKRTPPASSNGSRASESGERFAAGWHPGKLVDACRVADVGRHQFPADRVTRFLASISGWISRAMPYTSSAILGDSTA